jgi:hypothetical protein
VTRARKPKRPRIDTTAAYIRSARLIHIGNKEGLLCDGRIWLDVTDRVLKLWVRQKIWVRECGKRGKRHGN